MSVTPLVHDIAVITRPQAKTPNQLHHISYWLDNAQDILRAADILAKKALSSLDLVNTVFLKHSIYM